MTTYDSYARLEPRPGDRNLQRGFAAAVHDPCWFLARQWQMGEHQGENASTPLVVNYKLAASSIQSPAGYEDFDPLEVPAEAIVESSRDGAWTMGRRIAVGQLIAAAVPAAVVDARSRFRNPPPPYDRFEGEPDGLALWHLRTALAIPVGAFGPAAPAADRPDPWKSDRFVHEQDYPVGGATLGIRDHRGDAVDWYSVDASANPVPDAPGGVNGATRSVLPAPLEYPGAPNPRWWQIEDFATDIGGYPPDVAHFPTMLLVDLIYSHGDDWFLFPVSARAGRVVAISEIEVIDSFGRHYSQSDPGGDGLKAPADWSLFRCRGMDPGGLVLWNVAELPLEGPLLERVQLGIDEAANLLWAVERVIDGREFASRDVPTVDPVAHPPYQSGRPSGDATQPRRWAYVAGEGMVPGWHPYTINENDDAAERVFVQHRLVDYSRQIPYALPRAAAEVLQAGTFENPVLHLVAPVAIPSNGIEIERRKKLARDCAGNPLLWTQRQRKSLRTPPARTIRYDIAAVQRTD